MKTLFMHGFSSRPKEWQLEVLREHNLEPYALTLNYTQTPFSIPLNYIKEHEIEFVIGRSHGGFMAYWLSETLGIPALCINPHLSLRNKKRMRPKEAIEMKSPLCLVVLGTDDQLVDADRTLEYFAEEDKINPSENRKIKVIDGIGHWLTIDMYAEMVTWALEAIAELKHSKS